MKEKKSKKKDKNVEKLAVNILNNTEEPIEEDISDVPEIIEEVSTSKIPSEKLEKKEEAPESIVFPAGTTRATAFVIERRVQEVDQILKSYFGSKNGDYFVLNENTATTFKDGQRRRYKGILVEDKNGFRYNLWFNVTALGPVY